MKLEIPTPGLVVLIGASGAGKSTFASKHFLETEVISSDWARGMMSDDYNSMAATRDAFDLVHYIADKRLKNMKTVVIDATNVQKEARQPLVRLAKDNHLLPCAIVLDVPDDVCLERNKERPDRQFGDHVVKNHRRQLKRSLKHLKREGFRNIWVLKPEDIDQVEIVRTPLYNNKGHIKGPFDIIGDVHGCATELEELLAELGYGMQWADGWPTVSAPDARTAVFVGDLTDRGPRSPDVLRIVMSMVENGTALCVPGNHDVKLQKVLMGKKARLSHGLELTMEQMESESDDFKNRVVNFIDGLISHILLDDGKLCVAHAGMKQDFMGRASGKVRSFALYGDTTGERDEHGFPIRRDWAREYRGETTVVYGHTVRPTIEWVNNTVCIDQGCVFGGRLTALRYPEREFVSVEAKAEYTPPTYPLLPESDKTGQQVSDEILDMAEFTGKRIVHTRLKEKLTLAEENSIAALEVISRFGVDPRWMIYLPPTMSPSETSERQGYLEYPEEALEFYRRAGQSHVVAQTKHMGSRAVVVLFRSVEAAKQRLGVEDGRLGRIYTRTGRPFFNDELEREMIERLSAAMQDSGLFAELDTDWVCLDCELMPWSAKAQELLRNQYASVGAAARAGLDATIAALENAQNGSSEVLASMKSRREDADLFTASYRHYCWNVDSIEDYKVAPFHVLASEGAAHVDKDHRWHMDTIRRLCAADVDVLFETEWKLVDLANQDECDRLCAWWETLTGEGGEGLVIKPLDFVARNAKDHVVQPAVKCRGKDYLRIIYGMSYDEPQNLKRLRKRGLGRKRSLASREFALGVEALERFVRREPLRKVHECVFGVLCLESEPVDPRL